MPCREFERSQAEAYGVARVQAPELFLRQGNEPVVIVGSDALRNSRTDRHFVGSRARANDAGDEPGKLRSVAQAQRIRGDELPTHGEVLLARAFVDADEDVAQQFDPVEFVDAEQSTRLAKCSKPR